MNAPSQFYHRPRFASSPSSPAAFGSALPRGYLAQTVLDVFAVSFWIAFGLLEIVALLAITLLSFGIVKF